MKQKLVGISILAILTLILIPQSQILRFSEDRNDVCCKNVSASLFSGYSLIGYYTNSTNPFANAGYYLPKYYDIGNSIIPFADFANISSFSMIIIPFKENWSTTEVNQVNQFMNEGGIPF